MDGENYLFGPLPSRRLDRSLGIDIIPRKLCTLDCVYCELGSTDKRALRRKEFVPTEEVITQILDFVAEYTGGIDTITFSGSGEPTLHSGLGRMIHVLKQSTRIPIAVLTNGTLLFQEDVRRDLLEADIVLPSLDAGTEETFLRINRPHPQLCFSLMVEGLKRFRNEYQGKFWLEILFVDGINDSQEELLRLKEILKDLRPDKIHLNSVTRPPADRMARPLSEERLRKIRQFFGEPSEVVGGYRDIPPNVRCVIRAGDILAVLQRRAMTLRELGQSLEAPTGAILLLLSSLEKEEAVFSFVYRGHKYYQAFDSTWTTS